MLRYVLLFSLCVSFRCSPAQEAQGSFEQEQQEISNLPDQEFNDLLTLLDAFPELEPITRFPIATPAADQQSAKRSADDEWMLTFLTMLDEQSRGERDQAESELRAALMSLRRVESASEGQLKDTLAAAATNIGILVELVGQNAAPSDRNVKYAIAEAQRAMGLFHCYEANREAQGTLADSLSVVSKRLEHLSVGARFMMSAAETANYRIPESTKRTIASSVAMSKLFSPKEVPLSQIRTRARDITIALNELGQAIKRMR